MPAFDLIVIGAGPGGYTCAIRAAQLGLSVAIVEKRSAGTRTRLGGTCLNVGCIPSKALLDSSHHLAHARDHFAEHGIGIGTPTLDLAAMMRRKDGVVGSLVDGLAFLMRKNRIEVLSGTGTVTAAGAVTVSGADGTSSHTAKHIVLAMGSLPSELPFMPFDGNNIVSSDQAIAFAKVPEQLLVVGAGVIGLELGSVWSRLGAKVTVVEFLPQICPFLDADVAKELQRLLVKQGLTFHLETKVSGSRSASCKTFLKATAKDGKELELSGDKILVAVGRRPAVDGGWLAAAGIALTERQRIRVDHDFRTSLAGTYAIGDLIDGPMLAHKAEEEGVAVAELIAGGANTLDHNLIPNVIYTAPEVATVGLSEAEANRQGRKVRIGKATFAGNGRAKAAGETDGFVKLIADATSDQLLGGAVLGARASDLLAEITAVMSFGGSSEDIARTCHSHPTFSEIVRDAALATLGRPLNG